MHPFQLLFVGLVLLKAADLTAWPWWAIALPFVVHWICYLISTKYKGDL